MKKINLLIFVLLIIIAILGLTILMQKTTSSPQQVQQEQPTSTPPKPVKQPIVHYPVPTPQPVDQPEEKPAVQEPAEIPAEKEPVLPEKLPPVQQSDKSIQEALANLKLKASLFKLVLKDNFIPKLVATIDNLPEKRLPRPLLPLVPPKSRFIVSGTEEAPQTSSRNHARYTPYVELLEQLPQDALLKIYVYFYPLFQTAYEQLGYHNAYFNDRLVNVIDHLLETPDPAEPISLAQPSVLYTYADPLLEKRSAGQKILLRIGPENRKRVEQVLKAYRDKLVKLKP